jgi:glycosyltransferase involved in cell wall biosynthesis
MGGIASAVALLRSSRLFRDWPIRYVPTHCDGSSLRKFAIAIRAFATFVGLLALNRARLVHAHSASDASFWRKSVFVTTAFIARVPVVFHMHGAEFISFWREGSSLRKAVIKEILTRSSTVISLSDSWRKDLLTIAPAARVVVVPNPVEVRARDNRFRHPCRLLFLGRIGDRKGSFDLLQALAIVKSLHGEVRLYCGGDGELARFSGRAGELGLAANVVLLGWVRGMAKHRQLSRATLFVLPSHAEGLPMALLEAMACGVPVITTPVGGIPELVRDGVDGLLVPPGDPRALAEAIDRLLSDEKLRERLAASAWDRVASRYSVPSVVDRIEDVYRRLGASRVPRSESECRA